MTHYDFDFADGGMADEIVTQNGGASRFSSFSHPSCYFTDFLTLL